MNSPITISAEQAILLLEPIAKLEELELSADERDLRSVEAFSAPSRRAERLAWRRALRRVSPEVEVEYAPSGAPRIKNSPYGYISVSHCRDCVAVALSCRRCCVDVERMDRDFSRVETRYMTSAERKLCSEEWWMGAVWCAKECLYKLAEREGVDFLRDISVVALDAPNKKIICRGVDCEEVTLQYATLNEEHIVVYKI